MNRPRPRPEVGECGEAGVAGRSVSRRSGPNTKGLPRARRRRGGVPTLINVMKTARRTVAREAGRRGVAHITRPARLRARLRSACSAGSPGRPGPHRSAAASPRCRAGPSRSRRSRPCHRAHLADAGCPVPGSDRETARCHERAGAAPTNQWDYAHVSFERAEGLSNVKSTRTRVTARGKRHGLRPLPHLLRAGVRFRVGRPGDLFDEKAAELDGQADAIEGRADGGGLGRTGVW